METVDNRDLKQKIHDGWTKARVKVDNAIYTVKKTVTDHPQETIAIALVAIPGVLKCANSAMRLRQQSRETRYNECDYYDPRTGEHWYTRKPLTNAQKLNLETRYKSGESKGEILRDMKML